MDYNECKSEFIKTVESMARSVSTYQIVRDFAELTRITIVNQCTPFYSDDYEKRYMDIIKQYKSDEVTKFAHLFAMTQIAANDGYGDFLGETLMSMEMGNNHMGQYFTPYDLCRLNARMTIGEPSGSHRANGYFTMSEPAAGGGGMVIAAHEHATMQNIDMFAYCVELSDLTADLCYINLSNYRVPAQVVQGNSLSLKMGRCMPTPALCTDVWHYRLKYDQNKDAESDGKIYVTDNDKLSVDTGFKTMHELKNAMGKPDVECSQRLLIYSNVAFTDYKVN